MAAREIQTARCQVPYPEEAGRAGSLGRRSSRATRELASHADNAQSQLLFGTSGILLNHRNEMKIPLASQHETRETVVPPTASLQSAEAFEAWLRGKFKLPDAKSRIQKKPGGPVPWGGGQVVQPENWRVTLTTPNLSLNAEYWKGDAEAHIEQKEANAWATLANFHKGSGMSNAWILLTDTLAGGLLVLAITGTLLWSRLHGPRLMAAALIGTTLTASTILMLTTLSLS